MNIPLFDGHCDTALALATDNMPVGSLAENNLHIDLNKSSVYSKYAQLFAIFGYPGMIPGRDLLTVVYDRFMAELDFLKDKICFCTNKNEAEKAFSEHKTAAFLSVEGAEVLDCDIKRLEDAYKKGVRSLCITWNRPTELTGTNVQDTDRGLSLKGKDYVHAAQELGMILDVSHISDPGFWDLAKMTKSPFIASHSNSRAVYNHTRNLTDDMFKAVRDCGGTAGLNLYTDFLGSGNVGIDDTVRHIEHFLNLGGEKAVAIGCDLDGCEKLPEGIHNLQDVALVYKALSDRGYPKQLLEDIFFNNLMRVVESVCNI